MKRILMAFALIGQLAAGQRIAHAKPVPGGFAASEHQMLEVRANLPAYKVKPGLSNVANYKSFRKFLTVQQRAMIARNSFVVTPTNYVQMFHVYENNEYQRPLKMPAFITTDSMLHTYHTFYDYSLREIESNKLYEACDKLTTLMLRASREDYAKAKNPGIKQAALRNVSFFGVARALLDSDRLPSIGEASSMAKADLGQIKRHEGRALSKSVNLIVDFSQFVPRGHYTRTEK